MGLLAPKVSLRTGAWHPLSKFSGCPGTRGTRTAAAPAKEINLYPTYIDDNAIKHFEVGKDRDDFFQMFTFDFTIAQIQA